MDSFLDYFKDTTLTSSIPYITIIFRILLSFIAGFILGLERKLRQQTIGLRTLILICVSSTILMLLSLNMGLINNTDPGRIAAQVVSGIGFLGGGAILRNGLNIKGLTSAAIIWAAAALGLTIGAGMYIAAFSSLFVCMVSLILLEKFEIRYFPAERTKHLFLTFHNNKLDFTSLHNVIEEHGLIIQSMDVAKQMNEKQLRVNFAVKAPQEIDILSLSESIKEVGKLEEINFCD